MQSFDCCFLKKLSLIFIILLAFLSRKVFLVPLNIDILFLFVNIFASNKKEKK
ncbi:hypothetical protein AlmWB_03200 [Candidatus Phytoplasma phoenicium]|uniref:Uncharacterized protein n=1 Tax=Candidatus Phytoplasma phoenicium TaxID=198422 RepID=A0A0L0MIF6_9MOLU|nr:hypothetical protein AlmWB_03200 [Candidatus Phytoplasma phoenicium]